ncbi:MAG: hypothetical protein HYV38_02440 [Candidatus Levybacteria bacterium]|nr:hypothetical protein [Candidatus Levybacteria bacterium]
MIDIERQYAGIANEDLDSQSGQSSEGGVIFSDDSRLRNSEDSRVNEGVAFIEYVLGDYFGG